MSHLKAQVPEAVKAALSPGPSQAEAYKFLEDVKAECAQTWQVCLEIFLEGSTDNSSGQWNYAFLPEARMFALQVVDDVLSNRFDTIDADSVLAVQAGLLDYVKREYTQGQAEGQHIYLRNKVVHTLFLLFMQTYTSTWPDFFQSFFQLLSATSSSTEPYNAKMTDILLRLLHETSTEISDSTLRLNKAHQRLNRDTELRDAIRARDAANIADQVTRVLTYAMQRIDSPTSQISSRQAAELAEMAMRVLADYASWIDISLIVTPSFLPLFFQCLATAQTPIRLASTDLLFELISKGMSPTDKLELIRVLDVSNVITQLLNADDERKGSGNHSEQEELYREKLARNLNGLGLELTRIIDESGATDDQKEFAKSAALDLRPLALRFLGDEYDDTSVTVVPFLQSIMAIYKKEKKRAAQTHLTDEKAKYLTRLLETTISKIRYFTDDEWGGDDDDDDGEDEAVTHFIELRRNLKTLFDAVAWIDFDLFTSSVRQLVMSTLDSVDSGSSSLDWKDVEVALFALYMFGEPASKEKGTSGLAVLVQVPPEELKKAKTSPDHKINFADYPASALGEMLMRTIQSKVSAWPHPAVPLQFFECVSRYHEFFILAPQTILTVLPAFLDERGMHQEKQSIRSRCFYLFNRFIYTARLQLSGHLDAAAVTDICARVGDLLTIEATLPPPETPGEDVLSKAANRGSPFDSQLYLFEGLGTLISMLSNESSRQVELLQALFQPLLQDIQAAASTPSSDPESLLRLHHLIKAIGNIAYGFPELKNTTKAPDGQWVLVIQEAMRIVLSALKIYSHVAIIREASLGVFKSVAARTGEAALPLVGTLIECLIEQLTAPELVDFLPFIGMLVHRYKDTFAEMLDMLLAPVFDRTYFFLEQPVTGTDDIQQHSELRRAYFGLLLSIANANMHAIFASPRNAPRLDQLLSSLPHYLGNGALLLDQKVGFAVVNRLAQTWIAPQTTESNGNTSSLPQYKDFLYERIVALGLELPVRPDFDYSDAQAYQVIGEIAVLYKFLYNTQGANFTQYLTTKIFSAFGFPAEASETFLSNLAQSSDARQFKKWLCTFLQSAKKTSNDKPYSVAHLLNVVPSASQ